jgi:hypothetical protein
MMKTLIGLVLLLATIAGAQERLPTLNAKLVKTVTNYIDTSDDTTGFVTVDVVEVLNATEVGIITVTTDSVQATLYFIGTNADIPRATTTYADSISTLGGGAVSWDATTTKVKVTMLKDATVNRLPGCNRLKIGTVMLNSAHLGTTAGRTLKHYLFWRR